MDRVFAPAPDTPWNLTDRLIAPTFRMITHRGRSALTSRLTRSVGGMHSHAERGNDQLAAEPREALL